MIVNSTMDNDDGLQVQFYVQSMGKVLSQQVVIDAVNVRSSYYYIFLILQFTSTGFLKCTMLVVF